MGQHALVNFETLYTDGNKRIRDADFMFKKKNETKGGGTTPKIRICESRVSKPDLGDCLIKRGSENGENFDFEKHVLDLLTDVERAE